MSSLFLKSDRSGHVCITSKENYIFSFDFETGKWSCLFRVGPIECFAPDASNHPAETFGVMTGAQAQILS